MELDLEPGLMRIRPAVPASREGGLLGNPPARQRRFPHQRTHESGMLAGEGEPMSLLVELTGRGLGPGLSQVELRPGHVYIIGRDVPSGLIVQGRPGFHHIPLDPPGIGKDNVPRQLLIMELGTYNGLPELRVSTKAADWVLRITRAGRLTPIILTSSDAAEPLYHGDVCSGGYRSGVRKRGFTEVVAVRVSGTRPIELASGTTAHLPPTGPNPEESAKVWLRDALAKRLYDTADPRDEAARRRSSAPAGWTRKGIALAAAYVAAGKGFDELTVMRSVGLTPAENRQYGFDSIWSLLNRERYKLVKLDVAVPELEVLIGVPISYLMQMNGTNFGRVVALAIGLRDAGVIPTEAITWAKQCLLADHGGSLGMR